MEITTLIPRRIILFGQQNLHNSILISFIHQHTRIDCRLVSIPEWRSEWNELNGQSLVLIDTGSAQIERLQDLLEHIYDNAQNAKVALFNAQKNSPTEQLMSWPIIKGVFHKETSQQQLVKGINKIFNGEYWLSRRIIAQYLDRTRRKPRKIIHNKHPLTRREKQILNLTSTGATNHEIADQLNVSMHTVKTHIYNLFKKINVSNRIQAVNWAKDNLDDLQESII
jgi:LuxR family transcriptional regulator of csgAB operon